MLCVVLLWWAQWRAILVRIELGALPGEFPRLLLKDPGVLLKDPGVLLKDPGVLLKDPGVLANLAADDACQANSSVRKGIGMGAGNIYAMPGPAGVRPGRGRGPGVDFSVVFIR